MGRDFVLTRDSLIKEALKKVGAFRVGGEPTSSQYTSCAVTLNTMVKSWQSRGVYLWSLSDDTIAMVDGTVNYSVDNPDQVAGIENNMFIRDSNSKDWPVEIITEDEYKAIIDKSTEGRPTKCYIEWRMSEVGGTLYVSITFYMYPVPDQTNEYTLHYTKIMKLKDFDASGDNPDFPVYWSMALIWGLAAELSHEYGLPVEERDRIEYKAKGYFESALGNMQGMKGAGISIAPYRRRRR